MRIKWPFRSKMRTYRFYCLHNGQFTSFVERSNVPTQTAAEYEKHYRDVLETFVVLNWEEVEEV